MMLTPRQFGHNDQKEEKGISIDQYKANLKQFAQDVKDAGGNPVSSSDELPLSTPPSQLFSTAAAAAAAAATTATHTALTSGTSDPRDAALAAQLQLGQSKGGLGGAADGHAGGGV